MNAATIPAPLGVLLVVAAVLLGPVAAAQQAARQEQARQAASVEHGARAESHGYRP